MIKTHPFSCFLWPLMGDPNMFLTIINEGIYISLVPSEFLTPVRSIVMFYLCNLPAIKVKENEKYVTYSRINFSKDGPKRTSLSRQVRVGGPCARTMIQHQRFVFRRLPTKRPNVCAAGVQNWWMCRSILSLESLVPNVLSDWHADVAWVGLEILTFWRFICL